MTDSMNKTYVTFGQSHVHQVGGHHLHKDCVAVINHSGDMSEGRKIAVDLFGPKFCTTYFNHMPDMSYFPDGLVELN